jgi:hypothetical protein
MRMQLRAGTLVLALFGGIGLAAGQGMSGDAGAQEKLNLSKSKEDMISQGLKSEPTQSSPGYRGDVDSKPPDSLTQKQLPNDVTTQVPETKTYLFIKLPDRILLVDPDSKAVAEIVATGFRMATSRTFIAARC